MKKNGFTLIELLIVLVIIGIVSSIGVGAIMKAMQRNRVITAAEAVIRVHNEARRRAIAAKPTLTESTQMFGVAVVPPANGQSGYAVLLKGSNVSDVLMVDADCNGSLEREVLKVPFGVGIEPLASQEDDGSAPEPLTSPLVWWYGWGTGNPQMDTASTLPIAIGTPKQNEKNRETEKTAYGAWGTGDLLAMATPAVPRSPVCSHLAFHQGRITVSLEIYPLGPVNWEVDP